MATAGEAADLDVPIRGGFDNGFSTVAAGLNRRLAALDSEERYELLHEWSMPTEARQSVRVLEAFVSTEAPPNVFARALGERPRDESFSIANVADVSGLFSSAWELVVAADDAGRLRRLKTDLERLAERDVPNADHVLLLARIFDAGRRDEQLQTDLAAHLSLLRDGSPRPTARPEATYDAAWQYGCGTFDQPTARTLNFKPLSVWAGGAWRATSDLEGEELLRINRKGGHPANTLACIRRWTAPADGILSITGTLNPPTDLGDGVHARIVASSGGLLGECQAFNGSEATNVASIKVLAGDTIDFVVSKNASTTNDSFTWTVRLQLKTTDRELRYDSVADFCGPGEKHVMADAVIAAACLERNWLRAIGEGIFAKLIENTDDTADSPTLLPVLREAWATAVSKRIGGRESHLLDDVPLQHWLASNSSWFAREDQILHLTGSGDDSLVFKYPLTGEFDFSCEAQVGGNPRTNGGIAYGGLSFEIDDSDKPIGETNRSSALDRPEFRQLTLSVADDRARFSTSGRTTWPDAFAHRASPWLALQSRAGLAPVFRRLMLLGDPVIPREVRMSQGNELRGWLANDLEKDDWFAKDGLIRRAQRERDGETIVQSRLSYFRPLLDGEAISYEFLYEPGKYEVHPALGRLAFLIEPDGVRLHWMTDGDREWTGLAEDNAVVEPFDRRGPKPLPLVTKDWNRMTMAIQGGRVSISLNDKKIYDRKLAPHDARTFGFYHDANRSSVQVRNVVMRGDWPQRLGPKQFDDLAIASDPNQTNADRRALDYLFGERARAQSIMEVARKAAALSGEARYDYLASWVLSEQSHAAIRMWGTFAPLPARPLSDQPLLGIPSPIESLADETNRGLAGAQLIAPAIEFVGVAKQLGRLDDIRERVKPADERDIERDTKEERHRQALLALVNIADGEFGAAIEHLGFLVDEIGDDEAELVDRWPEMVAVWVAHRHAPTNEVARELVDVMFEHLRLGRLGESDVWKSHLSALAESSRFENELIAFQQSVLTEPFQQWSAVSHASARSRGQGFPQPKWQRLPNRVNNIAAHHRDYLYFQSPLRGNFQIECEVASTFGQQGSHLAYGGTFTLPGESLDHFGSGDFREQSRTGIASRFDPKLSLPGPWMRYRLVVQDGRMKVYFNGRLAREYVLPAGHDPWLAIRNHWERAGAVRDLRITGAAVIPETLNLATSRDLSGWLPYFDETVGTDWQFDGGELIGRKQVDSDAHESLLQFHRPMLEDGTIEYEFYYQSGESLTHPALGRLAFILDGGGVRTHWVTDGEHDRTGVDPVNLTEVPNRRDPNALPLHEASWNRLKLSLTGDTVRLHLNAHEICEHELEATVGRTFGLFHYADQTEARVRGITWKGNWLRELPPVNEQELAAKGRDFLDNDISKLTAVFEHTFTSDGLPTDRFTVYEKAAPGSITLVAAQPDGVQVTRPGAPGRYSNFAIIPRCEVKGDFDITASFIKFEPEPPDDTARSQCSIILSALLNDEAQTRAEFACRHVRVAGQDDGQRLLSSFVRNIDGLWRREFSGNMTCDTDAGTLRVARRGKKIYFLIAEHDSSYFRLVGEETCSDAGLQPSGIQLANRVLGPGAVGVVWTKLKIRASEIIDLADEEITKLQQQLTGDLPATALEFDGRTQYVSVPSLKYDGSHPITLEAYLTPDNGRSIAIGDNQRSGLGLGILAKRYRIQTWTGVLYNASRVDPPASTNLRVHLAGTFDGRLLSVFLNGRRASTGALTRDFIPSGLPLTIGASPPNPEGRLSYPFKGVIDAVRVSKTVRYTKDFEPPAKLEPDEQTLAVYRFDEGQGTVLADSSGNDHHGEIRGATWVGDMAIRRRAAMGLAAFGERAVPALVDALDHENTDIRLEAVNALGTMGQVAAAAVPLLEQLFNDDDQRIVAAAKQARARIAGRR
jgi:hypothetical protein